MGFFKDMLKKVAGRKPTKREKEIEAQLAQAKKDSKNLKRNLREQVKTQYGKGLRKAVNHLFKWNVKLRVMGEQLDDATKAISKAMDEVTVSEGDSLETIKAVKERGDELVVNIESAGNKINKIYFYSRKVRKKLRRFGNRYRLVLFKSDRLKEVYKLVLASSEAVAKASHAINVDIGDFKSVAYVMAGQLSDAYEAKIKLADDAKGTSDKKVEKLERSLSDAINSATDEKVKMSTKLAAQEKNTAVIMKKLTEMTNALDEAKAQIAGERAKKDEESGKKDEIYDKLMDNHIKGYMDSLKVEKEHARDIAEISKSKELYKNRAIIHYNEEQRLKKELSGIKLENAQEELRIKTEKEDRDMRESFEKGIGVLEMEINEAGGLNVTLRDEIDSARKQIDILNGPAGSVLVHQAQGLIQNFEGAIIQKQKLIQINTQMIQESEANIAAAREVIADIDAGANLPERTPAE